MPEHPVEVENTNPGCRYCNCHYSVSQLLTSTNSFYVTGRRELYKQRELPQEKREGFIENNINYVLSATYY